MAPPLPVPRPLPRAESREITAPGPPPPTPVADPGALTPDASGAVPVYFISDSTGISAETMGNALLAQFPSVPFERRLIPFLRTTGEAEEVREQLDAVMDGPVEPIVFLTVVDEQVREVLLGTRAPVIDFVSGHLARIEAQLGLSSDHAPARLHGLGDVRRYNRRMQAVEFAIEHDDGQSVRAIQRADVILIAPSRCGKTPTSMYLALMHGVFVANYPLVDEDFENGVLPQTITTLSDRCFGLLTSPRRLSEVRGERRPDSRYASVDQTHWELSRARHIYDYYGIPFVDSSSKSVEEMSTLILQSLTDRSTP
ncbi:pyruvate, water dikinase regulatory protein [Brachybacterium epidermidis]|uniref:pyruvate, water dikinase regulatory protein n=1 Tax=Brachybacterium epidermidis TaxID=2781983 RepID=UPI00398ED1C6